MKIQNYSPSYYCAAKIQKQTTKKHQYKQTGNDVNFGASILSNFIRSQIQQRKNEEKSYINYDEFINSEGKVTLKDYKIIKETNPKILAEARDKIERYFDENRSTFSTPDLIARMSVLLKRYLNQKYGNNYRIISIGTSPALLCEAMSVLGVETVFMPISNVSNTVNANKRNLYNYLYNLPNLKSAFDYIQTKGVNSKQEKKDDKINVFIDYTHSGKTLQQIGFITREYCKVNPMNIELESLVSLLDDACKSRHNNGLVTEEEICKFTMDIILQKTAEMCNVPHFDVVDEKNLSDKKNCVSSKHKTKHRLFREFEDFSRPLGRCYSLCVIDEMRKIYKKNPR